METEMETEKVYCVNCGTDIEIGDDMIVDVNNMVFCSDECVYDYVHEKQVIEDGYTSREQTVKDFDIKYSRMRKSELNYLFLSDGRTNGQGFRHQYSGMRKAD